MEEQSSLIDEQYCHYPKWDRFQVGDNFAVFATSAALSASYLFGITIGIFNASMTWIGSELWPCGLPSVHNREMWTDTRSWGEIVVSNECYNILRGNPTFDIAKECNSGMDQRSDKCGDCVAPSTTSCDRFTWWLASLSCAIYLGSFISTSMGSVLLKMSLRVMNLIAMIFFTIGALLSVCAGSIASMTVARILSGFALGMTSLYPPMWIAQMSPMRYKGMFGVMHQLFITLGILTGPLLGLAFGPGPFLDSFTYDDGAGIEVTLFTKIYWRCMVGLGYLIPVSINIYLYSIMDMDTPYEYGKEGYENDAVRCLKLIYKTEEVEEITPYLEDIKIVIKTEQDSIASGFGFRKALTIKTYRSMIIVGCMLSSFDQLSGINVYLTASNQLFELAGVSPSLVTVMSTVLSALNVIMTLPALYLIEKMGRKWLMVYGILGQCIGALLPMISAWVDTTEAWAPVASIVGIMLFVCSFAVSNGPVLFVWFTEAFPPEVNNAATSALLASNWFTSIIIVFVGVAVTDTKILFTLFFILNVVALIFASLFCKETKGLPSGVSPFLITDAEAKEYRRIYKSKVIEQRRNKK